MQKNAVARIIESYSQRQQSSPPPSPSQYPSSSPSSSNNDSDSDKETREPAGAAEAQRPRRGVWQMQKLVDNSQIAKEVATSNGKGKGPTRRKPGKKALVAAAEMSQLLDGYLPPPNSAVLLDK